MTIAVRSSEQVTECPTVEQGRPALATVGRAVVTQVTSLAQCSEVASTVVARVLIEVRGGEHDKSPRQSAVLEAGKHRLLSGQVGRGGHTDCPAPPSITPSAALVVPPDTIVTDRPAHRRLRLGAILAALVVIDLEIVALRIERRIDVAKVDAAARDMLA